MQHLFVSYEIAKQLKDKGFDEDCLCYYVKENNEKDWELFFEGGTFLARDYDQFIFAPLYQQVINWFDEKHKLEISITSWKKEGTKDEINYLHSVNKLGSPSTFKISSETKTEALTKAIEEALKLI